MATGKTHDKITIIMIPLIFTIFWNININLVNDIKKAVICSLLGVFIYVFAGYMFSGDLDIKSTEYYRWGIFKCIWLPYQKIFKHRSIFTHGFILGPSIRILYIYIIYLIICALFYSLNIIKLSTADIVKNTYLFIMKDKILFFISYLAIFLGAGIHTITDIVHSFINKKRFFKFRLKRKLKVKKFGKIHRKITPKLR